MTIRESVYVYVLEWTCSLCGAMTEEDYRLALERAMVWWSHHLHTDHQKAYYNQNAFDRQILMYDGRRIEARYESDDEFPSFYWNDIKLNEPMKIPSTCRGMLYERSAQPMTLREQYV